jgi:hypothetical protein
MKLGTARITPKKKQVGGGGGSEGEYSVSLYQRFKEIVWKGYFKENLIMLLTENQEVRLRLRSGNTVDRHFSKYFNPRDRQSKQILIAELVIIIFGIMFEVGFK